MSFIKSTSIAMTCDAGGNCTAYSAQVNGTIDAIIYTKGNFADGSTVTVTTATTGQAVWAETAVNASAIRRPRGQVHGATGTGLTFDGTRTVCEPVCVLDESIKVVVSSGGNATTGTLTILLK